MGLRKSQAPPRADALNNTIMFEEKLPRADIHQAVPIVDDVGSDHAADGVHSSSGDRAVALTWPDYAVSSSGEEAAELASPLPAQSLLTPEAFCMKFYQVR